jgi:hypothetical protein
VTPDYSGHDHRDRVPVNSEFCRELGTVPATILAPNLSHFASRELCLRVLFPFVTNAAPLKRCVSHIGSVRTEKQMRRIPTGRIIALMADFFSFRNFAVMRQPRCSIHAKRPALMHKGSVTSFTFASRPNKTGSSQRTRGNDSFLFQSSDQGRTRKGHAHRSSRSVSAHLDSIKELHGDNNDALIHSRQLINV